MIIITFDILYVYISNITCLSERVLNMILYSNCILNSNTYSKHPLGPARQLGIYTVGPYVHYVASTILVPSTWYLVCIHMHLYASLRAHMHPWCICTHPYASITHPNVNIQCTFSQKKYNLQVTNWSRQTHVVFCTVESVRIQPNI